MHPVLIKDFNTFMYDHTLHHGRKYFCHYCLQVFRTEEKIKCQIKIAVKSMVKKGLKFQESPLMIYADFENILVAEDNGKQNPN